MEFRFDAVAPYLPVLAKAVETTLFLTAAGFVIGTVAGLFVAVARMSKTAPIRLAASAAVNVVLATPVVVQLLWIFYVLPILTGIRLSDIAVLVVVLGVAQTAVSAENYRAGLQSVAPGQRDAAFTLGLSRFQTMRHVVLPQAIRLVLPPHASSTISLVKDSSIATFIGVNDLLNVGRSVAIETFRPIEAMTVVAVMYFILTYPISIGSIALHRRLSIGVRR